jgi:hypothetical protein
MKRLLLAFTAIIGFTVASYAQGGFRLGVKLGTNLNKIQGQSFDQGFDVSYHLGGFAEIDFNKKWGIQPEVLWSQTIGRRSDFDNVYEDVINPDGAEKVRLNYLSIPILLRYNVGSILTLNAGPQFGILLKDDKTLLQNGESAFKDGDFALALGGQLNFSFLRIYGRYNIGLRNINDIDDQEKWTNQQIQLGLGLRF